MKRLVLAALATTVLSGTAFAADIVVIPPAPPAPAPVVVVEQTAGGLYISTFGGLLWAQDADVTAVLTPPDFTIGTDRGYRFGGALGYQFNSVLGAEAEVAFGRVAIDTVTPDGGGPVDITGAGASASLLTVMGNLTVGTEFGAFRPYVAVGVGAARVGLDVPAGIGLGSGANDTDWALAFQALAGVDYAITDNISIGARFRFQHIRPTAFEDADGDPITVGGFHNYGVEGVLTVHF